MNYQKNNQEVITPVPVDMVSPSPVNTRTFQKKDIGLQELANSIESQGLISPVVVRVDPADKFKYELVAGERRIRAFKLLARKTISAIIRKLSDAEAYSITATENLQREDLTPLQEAKSVNVLLSGGATHKEVADRLGKPIRWVARRAKLVDLVQCWIDAFLDPENEISHWSAMHLECIARFDSEKQIRLFEDIGDGYHELGLIPVSELEELLFNGLRDLKSAPWQINDETLLPGISACAACNIRSSCAPDLFDFGGKKKGSSDDFCLGDACWGKKLVAFHALKLATLKEKHDNIIPLIVHSSRSSMLPEDHPWVQTIKYGHSFNTCKKSDKGSRAAYVLDGAGAGKIKYVKSWDESSDTGKTLPGQPKPMKERKEALLKRRTIRYITKILQLLDGVEPCQPVKGSDGNMKDPVKLDPSDWKVPGQILTHFELFALIAEFGAGTGYNRFDFNEYSSKPFAVHKKILEGTETDAADSVYKGIIYKIEDQLRTETNATTPDKEFPVKVCKALYLDSKRLWKMVLDEIKEPKIWATLNEDGTKKEITPKKKKSS